ncbi:MAG: hypothetical protein IJK10_01010, partial [Firmicutes bacterium]|nr:hypothetical protein [Bacillota bacterium]
MSAQNVKDWFAQIDKANGLIQDGVRKAKSMTAEDIAVVIAARQIADTGAGNKSRLESTKIDPVTLKERADKLLARD